jgi:hypothetical protein
MPKQQSVFERAEQAGAYLALRAEALRSDPSVLAIRHTASEIEASTLLSWLQQALDADVTEPEFDRKDRDARAIRRMSEAAAENEGYRVQLLDLAALHGGLYREAVDALYAIDARTLGRWEALARHLLDQRQIVETRARDRGIVLTGETGDGPTEA